MKQTSVDWLFHQLWEAPKDKLTWHSILEKAKQMENKQTAVEWLIQSIVEDQTIKAKSMSEWIKVFEQAKEMERKQIVDAHDNGYIDGANKKKTTAEQYYNATYGK